MNTTARVLLSFLSPFLLLISGAPCPAQQPHWYVLLEPGNVRDYVGPYNSYREEVVGTRDGCSVVCREGTAGPALIRESLWSIDAEGDVWMVGANGELYAEPVCYLDMPIEIGKSWGHTWGEWNQWYETTVMERWEDFDGLRCLVVGHYEHFSGGDTMARYWYADGHGLVHHMASCFGCSWTLVPVVVGAESVAWGAMKALYR